MGCFWKGRTKCNYFFCLTWALETFRRTEPGGLFHPSLASTNFSRTISAGSGIYQMFPLAMKGNNVAVYQKMPWFYHLWQGLCEGPPFKVDMVGVCKTINLAAFSYGCVAFLSEKAIQDE